MTNPLIAEINDYLKELEVAQGRQLELFERKHVALTGAEAAAIVGVTGEEARLAEKLHGLLKRRANLLDRAKLAGVAASSLRDVVVEIDPPDRAELLARIDRSREISGRIRRGSWVHWIISQRSFNHYSEVLELIANCGEKSPTYSKGPAQSRTGSAILDASA